jgi:DNA-3-methyladenine glycosylase
LLPRQFYARDALEVARDLLGQEIWHGEVGLRITEVEAYRHPDDSANHCRAGFTPRNAPMWGPPGHAYVYLCYGLHQMLNLVTNLEGEGAAVLIRSCEPIAGEPTISRRRGGMDGPALLTGPGKIGQALGLNGSFSGHPLYRRGGLEVREGKRPARIVAGSRIGIGYAEPQHQEAPWRLAIAGSPWVSHARQLRGAGS